jgi:RNA polymerase sigma-70 factor (ECF subfamily)
MPLLRRAAILPSEMSDTQLLRRVLRQDENAWKEFVRRFRALLYRCITKVISRYDAVLSSADPDEIYAEVLIALVRDDFRKLRLWDPRRGTKLSSWLGMIATNTAYDYLRGTARRPILDRIDGVPDMFDPQERSPLDELLEQERRHNLNDLLSDYSDKDRTFVALYYAQGMAAEDVADEMGISIKTVYSKKHKLLTRLQATFSANRAALLPA